VNQNRTQSTLWNKGFQSSCILFRESITKFVLHRNGATTECVPNQIHPFNVPNNSKT